MCGILYVKSRYQIPQQVHQDALELLQRRGPDLMLTYQTPLEFAAQSVLHITGNQDFYHNARDDFFAYNGEIYNYLEFGNYSNDVELAYHAAAQDTKLFKQFNGPWAWVYVNQDTVQFASDPQGERCLYYYQDQDWLVVSSEVSVILKYVSPAQQDVAYQNKCWTMISQTPWTGIHRCEPGRLYRNGQPEQQLDSVWSWIDRPLDMTETEANDEFLKLLTRAVDVMRPDCSTTVSYSAGVDSNIIMNLLGNCDLLSIDIVGKDPVVTQAAKFLTSAELDRLRTISVDPEQWAQCYQDLIKHTQMPGHWSHVGKWLVAKHSASPVIFTGLAADELFGGYSVYQTIDYTHDQSHSPYSQHDHENIWDRCISSYQGDARSATLLMDYWYQVVGVDTPGLDQAGGAWGKETRNPFMDRTLMQFALNLPWHLRVGAVTKPLIKQMFLQRWPESLNLPKMGFAGHANDSLPWLNIDVSLTGRRDTDWKEIAKKSYYAYTKI